ncbi:pitrilysin family protein [Chelativorans sp. AA-79]|uniref:M16 family metallopeptidase n=1 Tax=Chelativorans sp. AA-79 TaxID=3028735 RepID=UPI0023F81505|nr:pitrilysin family protein [Chelativorans sp. AA-79]WEX08430.1 pitrilysin family protein [Chelativorans sp. AA-79]
MRLFSLFTAFLFLAAASLQASAQSASGAFEAETFSLENGLQVVVIPQRRVPVVTHVLFYKAGAADEERGQSGIAHFFEHLMFKATTTHESGEFEAAVKAVGGSMNAFTTSDFTAYFEQVPPSALGEMMAFEADRMRNLVLSDDAIETERRVVMEERLMRVDNNPSGMLREAVGASLFHNHPYGTPVIGWMHEIKDLTKQQLQAFYDRYYRPNNAVLVVAGDVDTETVRKLAEETYGKLERGPDLPPRVRPMEPEHKVEQASILRDARVTLPSFSRNWFGPAPFGEDQEDVDALLVLSTILGGGERSRLYQELVVKKQIASAAGAWTSTSMRDYSQIGVYASPISPDKLREVEQAVDAEIKKMAVENVSDHELETAKKVLASQLILGWERQMSRALEAGTTLMLGGTLEDVASIRERIDAVTADNIREVAQRYLSIHRSVAGYLLPMDAEDPA